MGTKTVDEAGAENGAAAKAEEERTDPTTDVTKSDEAVPAPPAVAPATGEAAESDVLAEDDAEDDDEAFALSEFAADAPEGSTHVGQGAAAVVAAALGLVSLTGSWIGTVAAARQQLVGQLQTSSSASVATQVKSIYGDSWQASALWGGIFALVALIVGVFVLVRPAFGAPGRPQAVWIKSVSWAGVVLAVIGLLLAVLKYTDVLLGLPSAS